MPQVGPAGARRPLAPQETALLSLQRGHDHGSVEVLSHVARGDAANLSEVEQEIRERDRKDMTRVDSPLTRAADAILLDTTRLSVQDVLEQMLQRVNQRLVATQSR